MRPISRGGYLSSDGGSYCANLSAIAIYCGIWAGCFIDYRDRRYIEHTIYEDLNDPDHPRRDPLQAQALAAMSPCCSQVEQPGLP